jgi:hypothetical protein
MVQLYDMRSLILTQIHVVLVDTLIYFKKPLKRLMFLHFYLHLVKPGLYQLSLLHLLLIILTHMKHLF